MENASKALLIAAAIIIAVILIVIGVYVLGQGRQAIGNVNMSEQEIDAFNSKWEMYLGPQLGSNAKALINAVNNYNASCTDGRYIELHLTSSIPNKKSVLNNAGKFNTAKPNHTPNANIIGSGDSCFVACVKTPAGLICGIAIEDAQKTSSTNDDCQTHSNLLNGGTGGI